MIINLRLSQKYRNWLAQFMVKHKLPNIDSAIIKLINHYEDTYIVKESIKVRYKKPKKNPYQ